MKKDIKALWVAALRSGEYDKGTQQLRKTINDHAHFCCLGILCNLHAQAFPDIAAAQTNPQAYMGSTAYPPPEVLKWAGLRESNPRVMFQNSHATLSGLNDNRGLSFNQIADVIEAQL